MTKIRVAIASAAIALSVTAVAAQRMFADFSGKWNVAIDAQGQSMQSLMTVTQKGDSVSGTTESQIGTANFASSPDPTVGMPWGTRLQATIATSGNVWQTGNKTLGLSQYAMLLMVRRVLDPRV